LTVIAPKSNVIPEHASPEQFIMRGNVISIVSMIGIAAGCTESPSPSSQAPVPAIGASGAANGMAAAALDRAVVKLTDSAIEQFRTVVASDPTKHVRLSVKREGPTGYMYDLQIDDSIADSDFVDRSHGFTLVVDAKSALFLEGATIDWQVESDGRAGFKFSNPNAIEK